MSRTSPTDSKAWLNAKDNWLGEGPFRPAQDDLRRLAHKIGRHEGSKSATAYRQPDVTGIEASDVYFAHG
jgi:hypothetical protein